MRTTTYDIAKACGVSQATVDRALNNRNNINPQTKEMVLNTAEKMGYRPNNLPKYLKTGKTKIIGIILPKSLFFYAELISRLTRILREMGYHTCISFSDFCAEQENEYLSEFLKMNVDGIILFPVTEDGTEICKVINAGTPVVTIVRKLENYNFDFISINYEDISDRVIQNLIDMGHRNICYYTIWDRSSNYYSYNQRLKGYKDALKRNALPFSPELVIKDDEDYRLAVNVLRKTDRPTAFYCFNELNAIGLISHLNALDISVPDDLSVVSFDNTGVLRYFNPRLTSVAYPYEEVCRSTVDILLNKIENPSAECRSVIFDAQIIHRNSCKRIPS